ncbi:hypothetical protein GP486_004816 [Trichoglossum hirsutum]|uniref:Uncharacterized protein n=1 Tax=Trichoglossum hirsutum TaxID=265104 RepID=A0A9P8RNE2_9PEZI|nr:hypothetical protein GP486_004816 [Trichoglossum hirsutum]
MQILEKTNRVQDKLHTQGGREDWDSSYDTTQRLTIQITSDESEDGLKVGLTQTLASSKRVATYEGGGTLTIIPQKGLPCLDGNPETIPWYNEASSEVTLDHKKPQTLTMDDSPTVTISTFLYDPTHTKKEIDNLDVSEDFILTLYEAEGENIIKQWTWGYSYYLEKTNGDIYKKPTIVDHAETPCQTQDPAESKIELKGPVATDNPDFIPSEGWTRT